MRWALMLASALGLMACSDPQQYAVYQHDQCHRLILIDKERQMEVIGAEDIVRLPDGDLLISAYDRRSKGSDGMPPEGGIYRVTKDALNAGRVEVSSLIPLLPGGLRPHGIDAIQVNDTSINVAFVNRSHLRRGILEPTIVHFSLENGEPSQPTIIRHETYCRANDVAFYRASTAPHSLAITLDRKYCNGFDALFENATGRALGSVTTQTGNEHRITYDGLAFANGIGVQYSERALGENNFIVVAETRANRLQYFPKSDAHTIVDLPGSPDNITVGRPGLTLAALHPSLLRLALYRYRWPGFSRAPSRIVKVTGNQVLLLFDDPKGEIFSAASVAVQTVDKLVLGSVGDSGLLVCAAKDSA